MAIDYSRLLTMQPDEALAYLRENYGSIGPITQTFGGSDVDPAQYAAPGYETGMLGYLQPTVRSMYGGGEGDYTVPTGLYEANITGSFDPEYAGGVYGHYVGTFDSEGNLRDVRFQKDERHGGWLSENLDWIGPLVVGGAMLGGSGVLSGMGSSGAAASSGGISPGVMAGLETAVPGAGLTPGTVTLSAADLAAAGIGTETLPMLEMAATVGEGAAVPGLGTGTFGMNPATWTTPALAAMESSTLPALTAAGEGILGATLPSAAAITAATTGGGLLEGLLTGRNLASLAAGIYGAATSGDTRGGTTTATREPWAPAQPYLMGLLEDNDAVLESRKAMPWTDQYKAGVQNLTNRADAFGASLPGLLGFVNAGMSQQPYQPQFMPQAMRPAAVTGAPAPVTDYFQTPTRSTYGAIDWNAMNPFLRRT